MSPTNTLKVLSMNVRGMRNAKKRRSLFYQYKKGNYDIIGIQDTHLALENKEIIDREWGNNFYMVPGTNRSKGIITLFSKSVDPLHVGLLLKNDRCLINSIAIDSHVIAVVNIYAPCINNEKIEFISQLNQDIRKICEKYSIDNVLLFGDFNIVQNNELDIIAGLPHAEKNVLLFNNLIIDLQLNDVWRVKNGKKKMFTWCSKSPFTARRLDYIFINNELIPFCTQCDIVNLGFSDHKAVNITLDFSTFKRGHDIYKFNIKLLHNTNFVNEVKREILRIKLMNLNPHDKWEYIKIQIKALGIVYGKSVAFDNYEIKQKLINEIRSTEEFIINNPENISASEKLYNLKQKLDIFIAAETEGARIRCREKWIEDGEKCTKFFLNLEKQRALSNTVYRIETTTSNSPITNCDDILTEIKLHFESLYQYQPTTLNNEYFAPSNEEYIDEDDRSLLDSPITQSELLLAIKNSKRGSAPGLDGLPNEIYAYFWHDIKEPLIECINFSFQTGELSSTQKEGLISLIYKGKGLNREVISNWRPISLTNSDYKLIAKILAHRLNTCLHKCIGPHQHAFIKGRYISHMLREIDDIIELGKSMKSENIILSLDYEKAFDTLSTDAIIKALHHYGLGEHFIRWIQIILFERKSCIKNGGHLSDFFQMFRGVRQGCPVSPLLFILTVELFAKNIRNDKNIRGIAIPGAPERVKILQYADDTTLFLKDLIDYREILAKIKAFADSTGLKLNKMKSNAMFISNPDQVNTYKNGIKFVNKLKILGITFSNECSAQTIKENYDNKIERLEKLCTLWSKRHLSFMGKITILKSYGISLFIHIMQSIGINRYYLEKINQILFRFIWKKKFSNQKAAERVKRSTICASKNMGGLNMIDITTMQKSFYLEWAEKYLNKENQFWKYLVHSIYCKVGGSIVFKSNVEANKFKGLDSIKSFFWKNVLCTWLNNNNTNNNKKEITILSPICNNKFVTYKNETLYFPQCFHSKIYVINDMIKGNEIMSLIEFNEIYGKKSDTQLVYNIIYNALYRIKEYLISSQEDSFYFKENEIGGIGRKRFFDLIRSYEQPLAKESIFRKYNLQLSEIHWLIPFSCTNETYLHSLQWKIIHEIYPTGTILKKIKIRQSDMCQFCGEMDSLEHFFFNCSKVKCIWDEISRHIEGITNKYIRLTAKKVMIGLDKGDVSGKNNLNRINHLILIGKATISKAKYVKSNNFLTILDQEMIARKISFKS